MTSIFAFGILPTFLTLLLLSVILLLYLVIKKEDKVGIKELRYEAGNLPKYDARTKFGFQYLGFFILFASFEPLAVLLLLTSFSGKYYIFNFAYFVLIAVGVSIPILLLVLKLAEKIENWLWD